MICKKCGNDDECRMGICFDCASAGEARAAKRTVIHHIGKGISHFVRGYRTNARIDFQWAWERFTQTGDYAPGGEFERSYGVTIRDEKHLNAN